MTTTSGRSNRPHRRADIICRKFPRPSEFGAPRRTIMALHHPPTGSTMLLRLLLASTILAATTTAAAADPVDDIVREYMQASHIPGVAIAVIKDGEVSKMEGYGQANLEWDSPVTPDTPFQ